MMKPAFELTLPSIRRPISCREAVRTNSIALFISGKTNWQTTFAAKRMQIGRNWDACSQFVLSWTHVVCIAHVVGALTGLCQGKS
jgi:hypothetical protein